MKKKTTKELYDEAYKLIKGSMDPEVFDRDRKRVRQERRNQFYTDIQGLHASQSAKDHFEAMLRDYIIAATNAHNFFVICKKSGTVAAKKEELDELFLEAARSNVALYKYEFGISNHTQYDMSDDALRKDQVGNAIKDGAKRVGNAAGIATAIGLAVVGGGVLGNALFSNSSKENDETDKKATGGEAKMVQHVSAEDMAKYQQSQQGWTIGGGFVGGQQIQSSTETEVHDHVDVHDETHVQRIRPQAKPQKKTVVMVDDVTIQDIQQQVEQNTAAFQAAMNPQAALAPAPVVVQAPTPVVVQESEIVGAVRDVGVAALNAWGMRGSRPVVDNSVQNITVNKNSGNTYNHVHDNGNDYSDHSVRVKKDSHNRTTSTINAQRTTQISHRSSNVQNVQVHRVTKFQKNQQLQVKQPQVKQPQVKQPVQQVCTPSTPRTSAATIVRTARPASSSPIIQRMNSGRTVSTPKRNMQNTPTSRPSNGKHGGSPVRSRSTPRWR